MSTPQQLVQKLWNYCNILRDDGLSYGDYVEQLTFFLFLKMADEQSKPPFNKPSPVPKGNDWASLLSRDGDDLETHYRHVLAELGNQKGMLGVIFRKAQNKIQDPAKLRRLIADLIDKEQWSSMSADVKGDAYEGLLQKNSYVPGGRTNSLRHRPWPILIMGVASGRQSLKVPAIATVVAVGSIERIVEERQIQNAEMALFDGSSRRVSCGVRVRCGSGPKQEARMP